MKKILYITLLLFTCISCDEVVGNYNKVEKERRQKRIEEHINDTTDLQDNLYNVKFDGHLYVVYKERRQKRIEEHINDTTDLQENLQNVKFDGHLYVVYTEKNGYGFGAAMVHSPNCECHKEKLNDEKNCFD